MPRLSQHPKEDSFNFRIDPGLKADFQAATEAEDKPAAQMLRDFMRDYVARRRRQSFATEAERQSRPLPLGQTIQAAMRLPCCTSLVQRWTIWRTNGNRAR